MKTPVAIGKKYMIKEWDDTLDVVEVIHVVNGIVSMQYDDGVIHRVSEEHFSNGLHAVEAGSS